jgi:hypothetical protein
VVGFGRYAFVAAMIAIDSIARPWHRTLLIREIARTQRAAVCTVRRVDSVPPLAWLIIVDRRNRLQRPIT